MSYLLCLGFISYQYKKEPTVRLFVDDIFIDEFELCKSHDSKLFKNNKNIDHTPTIKGKNTEYYNSEYTNYLKQLDPSVPWNMFKKVLKYNKCPLRSDMSLRFYKLHDHFIKKSKNIRLEIQSNDSNFTNGFMTSSTTYSLRVAYLIPQEIYKNPKKYFQKYDQQVKQYNRNHKDQHEIKQFYKKSLVKISSKPYLRLLDPDTMYHLDNKNKKIDIGKISRLTWFGGTRQVILPLSKNKLVIDQNCVENDLLEHDLAYALCNKYKQYENH